MTHRVVTSMFAALALCTAAGLPRVSRAQDTGWTIPSFSANYTVNADRSIDVTERIDVDFGPLQKHGIYRDIPVRYAKVVRPGSSIRAGTVDVALTVLDITDGNGQKLATSITRGRSVRIRIGDANGLVSGTQTYLIHYRLGSGLGFFADHDELYWQATGTEWPVPILAASATVRIAAARAAATSDTTGWSPWCYAGVAQSTSNERCTARYAGRGLYQFTSGRLDPGEGLTFVAAFPKGVIAPPTASEQFTAKLAIWWPLGVPVVGFLALLLLWARHGRDPDPGSIVPVWNPPKGLPAGAAGALVNQRAGMNDIVATVIDMAVRGYLTINEVAPDGILGSLDEKSFAAKALRSLGVGMTDWNLIRTAKPPGDLVPYEQSVMDGVFEDGVSARRMSDLHNEFYKHLPTIKKGIYTLLIQLGLFRRNPETTRGWYIAGGISTMIFAVALGIKTSNVVLGVGIGLLAVMLLIFSNFMPAKTAEGARRWREVKGLEEYIRRAEKQELEMTQAPEKTTQLFSMLLPYAIALKVSDIWVKQFGDLLRTAPPTWYTGTSAGFSVAHFSSGLSNFQTAASHTMASAPGGSSGSGGGGSVGGGGGGGGGGSW